MQKEFIPYEQALEIKELGFNEYFDGWYYRLDGKLSRSNYELEFEDARECCIAPLYQQAFRWFREKYGYTFCIGRTNICVYHLMVQGTLLTNMIQDCTSYEQAELKCLTEFIDAAKQKQ